MNDMPHQAKTVSCPRCGYDQRGVVESWADACPTTGVCTECGLEFEWRELLNPAYGLPRWCVEYADGWPRVPLAIARTLWTTLRPWHFWGTLKMTHSPRLWRMVAYLGTLGIALYLVFAVSVGIAATRCWPFNATGNYTSTVSASEVAWFTAWRPLSMRTLGSAMPNAQGKTAGATPLGGAWPKNAFDSAFLVNKPLRLALVFAVVFFAACPLGFVVLPHTRKRAKVRWGHIARIFAYSLGGAAIIVALILWSGQDRMKVQVGGNPWLAGRIVEVTIVLTTLFLASWWYFASSRYLRMTRAWVPVTAVMLMAGLAASVASTLHHVIGIPSLGLG